jgi:putative tricarboxylic transport membrane protein
VSHESLAGTFAGHIVLPACYEAGLTGICRCLTIAAFGGLLKKFLGLHIGVQYMAFYASPWIVGKILG